MATALKVKEAVKESLLGTEEQTQLSAQARTQFLLHAKRDKESGDLYMGKEEFVNAIAPPTEDYVCISGIDLFASRSISPQIPHQFITS
jgi:solute carrier family 25 (mitochondrial aspartate/glutamate transporter), member 12/13